MSVLLAFDTSTERLAVGLRAGGRDHTADVPGGAQASAGLLPQVKALLAGAGVALRDVDAIAFGAGPGAFTGLRTSCAVAQGLAFGIGCPVLPLDSLLVVAEDARLQAAAGAADFDVGVVMDARMDEIYAGRYRWTANEWAVLAAPALFTLPALAAQWAPPADPPPWLAGSALQAFGGRLDAPAGAAWVNTESGRAGALLRLAQSAFDAGGGIDAAAALPLYVRDKVAFTTAERAAMVRA